MEAYKLKLIFFSDIHGNKYSFQAFLTHLDRMDYDKVIFCGDVFGYYYYAEEIVQEMRVREFCCLLGNHDAMLLDMAQKKYSKDYIRDLIRRYGSVYDNVDKSISKDTIDFLSILKPKLEFGMTGFKIGVFHGTPDDPLNGRLYPDTEIKDEDRYNRYDCVILGHTHHKMVRHLNHTLILNPGSLGQQRDGRGCSYLIVDTIKKIYQFKVVEYNYKALIDDVHEKDPDKEFLASVLTRTPRRRAENESISDRL